MNCIALLAVSLVAIAATGTGRFGDHPGAQMADRVTYDGENKVVKSMTLSGARYVWQVTVAAPSKTVTISGQASKTVTAPWTDLEP